MNAIGPAISGAMPSASPRQAIEAVQSGASRQAAGTEGPAQSTAAAVSAVQPPVNAPTQLQEQSSAPSQDRSAPQDQGRSGVPQPVSPFDISKQSLTDTNQSRVIEQAVSQAAANTLVEERERANESRAGQGDAQGRGVREDSGARAEEAAANFESARSMLSQPDPSTMSKVA